MDQDAFRETYREVNERFCAFEKSVLTNRCDCARAERFCIAEREGVHCGSQVGQRRCLRFLALVREHAQFALRTHEDKATLPHGKAMRLQVGGMRGVRALLEPDTPSPREVPDVDALLASAEQSFGDLERLPFSELMPHIAAYEVRPRRSRRR